MNELSSSILVVNFKNYPEILGKGSVLLAEEVQRAAQDFGVLGVASPPIGMLGLVASSVRIPVFSQGVDSAEGDKTTGALTPEAVKGAGAAGCIFNHSEARRPVQEIERMVPRLNKLGLTVCLCAKTTREAVRLSRFKPRWLAIEPPELIGSGIAVSRAKPELVSGTVSALRESGYKGRVLCGAGIVTGIDAKAAMKLGADGILVSSSVVKAEGWGAKLDELCRSLV